MLGQDQPWFLRKRRLLDECSIASGEHADGTYNLAVRLESSDETPRMVRILDLQLPMDTEGMMQFRCPVVTKQTLALTSDLPENVRPGEDYMLVGAKVFVSPQISNYVLEWPELSKASGYIALSCETHAICSLVALFCGGMGAWSKACEQLPLHVSLCLDRKIFAIQSVQINELLQCEHSLSEASLDKYFCGDVGDLRIMSRLQTEEGLMASPPCQGFSNLGKGLGLDSRVAEAWASLFKVLRFVQRRFLLLENVVGLLKHRDFKEIRKMVHWCGYTLVHQRVCDASSMGCTSRLRLMIIAWNTAEWKSHMQFMSTLPCDTNPPARPRTCDEAGSLWKCMPACMRRVLLLNQTEVTLLALREHLPPWQKTSRSVWDLRRIQGNSPLPSITASYYACTSMPAEHVKAKGLYVPVQDTSENFRRLCKWEILHSLGLPMSMCLPQDEQDAIPLLGESFPPIYALCPLILALANRPQDRWSQDKIDATFLSAWQALSPAPMAWDELCEVDLGGGPA